MQAGMFSGCEKLAEIKLPNSLTDIYSGAFNGCKSLSSIAIHKNVVNFAFDALLGCENLRGIEVEPDNEHYAQIDGVLYTKDLFTLVCYPLGKTNTSYTVENNTRSIGAFAFAGNKKLQSVYLQNVWDIRVCAFYGCENLLNVTC